MIRLTIIAVVLATATAMAQTPPTAQLMTPAERARGYLTPETRPDAFATIPPAPKEGEPRNDADWTIFRKLRALEGTDRWKLAQNDDQLGSAALLKDFSCAIGAELTPANAPTLATILGRTQSDAGAAAERAKQIYKRTRPYLHNPGNICVERSQRLSESFDYPSGHSSIGFTTALVLSELAPDRSTQLMTRGRAYGDSRLVCGVHNWSAVEGGRTNGAGVYAALHGSQEFMTAMSKAREEVDTARKSGPKPDAAACAKEAELTKPLVLP